MRQLPSGILATMATSADYATKGRALKAQATGATTTAFQSPTNAATAFVSPTGRPTRATRQQTLFLARFEGPYGTGAGRTSTESLQLYLRGAGGSNQFLHGSIQLRYVVSRLPDQAPVGVAVMLDRNINNGSQLGLDLTAVPGQIDQQGRVRKFTWTIDSNYSSGYYSSAAGQGTLTVRYGPLPPGRSGAASVAIRGQILSGNVSMQTTNSNLDP